MPRAQARRGDLRAMTGDGIAYSVMVGLGETYLPAFVLAIGLGQAAAALVATLPLFAGSLLQLVTPAGVRRLGSYRRWVVFCAVAQALSLLPLAAVAVRGHASVVWVFGFAAAYWGFGMATSPAWNAWVGTLVPPPLRARYFSQRTRYAQLSLFVSILGGGALLDLGTRLGHRLGAFALLFVAAVAARMLSSRFIASQSEAPGLARSHSFLGFGSALGRIRQGDARRLVGYLLVTQVGVSFASPLFTPYMLGPLGLSYTGFMVLTAAAFLARIAILPWLGRRARRHGTRTVLWWGAVFVVPLPALWLVSHDFTYLLGVQLVAGCAWAAVELATLLSFFETLRLEDRASILTAYNLLQAAAVAAGAAVGAFLLHRLGDDAEAFSIVFLLSSAARLLSLALLRGAPMAETVPEGVALRTLAVRPSAGAMQRPILPALETAEAAEPAGGAGQGGAPPIG